MWKQATVLLFLSPLIVVTKGDLLCYSCQIDGAATDRSCINKPEAVSTNQPTVKCKYSYCTIIRMEYIDPEGKIYSFYRGCAPKEQNSVVDGGGYRTYTRTCKSSLCNDWDGKDDHSGSGGSGGSGGGSGNGGNANWDPGFSKPLIGPGKRNSGVALIPVFITTVVVPLAIVWLVAH